MLKVKEWLRLRRPDEEGFLSHMEVWKNNGITYGFSDVAELAKNYGLKMSPEDEKIIIKDNITIKSISINITVRKTGEEAD